MSSPLPCQICPWLNQEFDSTRLKPSVGQWLYCLKATKPGDRQIVWSGIGGAGLAAVVDFNGEVRPRQPIDGARRNGYEGWGRITNLAKPISVGAVQADPTLTRLFSRSIQSVWALTDPEARAVNELAGGLPTAPAFQGNEADWREESGDWGRFRLPPEAIAESIVLDRDRTARKIGFPSRVNPAGRKQHLANGLVPDLWCAEGVVGEVKNQVTASWGPSQIEAYIEQCDRQWPDRTWRGLLIQGEPEMAPNAVIRLKASRYHGRLEVWSVRRRGRLRVAADRLFP